jgi:hypothetical protein
MGFHVQKKAHVKVQKAKIPIPIWNMGKNTAHVNVQKNK